MTRRTLCSLPGSLRSPLLRVCSNWCTATTRTSRSYLRKSRKSAASRGKSMRPASLKEAVDRSIAGYGFVNAINEFLDEFYLRGPSHRQQMIGDGACCLPACRSRMPTSALLENTLPGAGIWTFQRGLMAPPVPRHALFPRGHGAGKARVLDSRDSPIAFRRRLIFTEAEPLRRARFPKENEPR